MAIDIKTFEEAKKISKELDEINAVLKEYDRVAEFLASRSGVVSIKMETLSERPAKPQEIEDVKRINFHHQQLGPCTGIPDGDDKCNWQDATMEKKTTIHLSPTPKLALRVLDVCLQDRLDRKKKLENRLADIGIILTT